METIKNYLESMFKNLPQNEKVLRAKSELLQMMEDKYTELIKEGKSENEAVGTVISEFGNLEELVEDLGIADVYSKTREEKINRRVLTFDEVQDFLSFAAKKAQIIGIAVLLCILCVTAPIITKSLGLGSHFGAAAMFVIIAAGVVLFIIASSKNEQWRFLRTESCTLDKVSQDYVIEKRRENSSTYTVKLTVGILLCILSVIPPILLDNHESWEYFSAVFLFLFVGTGVYLIVSASMKRNSFQTLLNLKNQTGMPEKNRKYSNKTLETIMSVYWPTVTCLYLCVSFLSGSWEVTWIIWPIAAVARKIIETAASDKEDFAESDGTKNQ